MTTLELTSLEWEQLKVLYTALYVGLGLIPSSQLTKYNHIYALTTRSLARDLYDSAQDTQSSPKSKDTFNQCFPTSLGEVVQAFQSEVAGIEKSVLLNKWRWTTRIINSDLLLLKYIRDNVDTVKTAKRVGAGLRRHLDKNCNAQQELSRGESFYSKTGGYANFARNRVAYLSGVTRSGAPVLYFRLRNHNPKESSLRVKAAYTLNLLEHAQLALPPGVQGCVMVWDMKGWKPKNRDTEWTPLVVKYIRDCYPALVSKIYLVNSPRVFHLFWNLIYTWMHSGLRDVVEFTNNIEDVYQHVSPDQLPREFGGTSTYEPLWSDPRPEDELNDPDACKALEIHQSELQREFESATVRWLCENPSDIQVERAALIDRLEEVYWKLDPHVRSRFLWDRHGALGLTRKELVAGNVAQPKCKVDRPAVTGSAPPVATIQDSESDSQSSKVSLDDPLDAQPHTLKIPQATTSG